MSAALVAALVDFHKVQCFFSSTIQITALILFQQAQSNSAKNLYTFQSSFKDFFDTSILIVLATSGLIPISLTLACISRYGRQPWYLLTLSLVTIMLATTTLAASFVYVHDYGKPNRLYGTNMGIPYLYNNDKYNGMSTVAAACDVKGSVGRSVYPLCGSWGLENNYVGVGIVANHCVWAIWANCVVWLSFCMGKHWYDSGSKIGSSLRSILTRVRWSQDLYKELCKCRIWTPLSLTTWSLCLGAQFYLFSVYFEHSIISRQWSFGQIIAVTVWVPFAVEYIYIEYSKLRLRLQISKDGY